jgi:drug/metabolite transporter (DMT)-like permease
VEAWLLFDEALPPIAIAAILLTVLGVYLVVKKPTKITTKTKLQSKQ